MVERVGSIIPKIDISKLENAIKNHDGIVAKIKHLMIGNNKNLMRNLQE